MIESTATVRLTIDVTYSMNGEDANDLLNRLREMCEGTICKEILACETNSKKCSIDAAIQPDPLSEDDLSEFMLDRIENGEWALGDIPVRLARYGLMEPSDFVNEMRERMSLVDFCPTKR